MTVSNGLPLEVENTQRVLNGLLPRFDNDVKSSEINGTTLGVSGHHDDHTINYQPVDGHASGNPSEVLNDTEEKGQVPVAVCGMAVRLPAGLNTPQKMWDYLLTKGDARSKVPPSRYNVSAFYNSSGKPGTVITEHGYFLDGNIDHLDTSFFTMTRTEVERLDPQQRLMLEVARECLEDAGVTDYRGRNIGCYIGSLGEDWCEMFARESQNWGNYRITGHGDFALSNRVSYEMDLRGPRCVQVQHLRFQYPSNVFQYDHSNCLFRFSCGSPRSMCSYLKRRLRCCNSRRRQSHHESRCDYEHDRAERSFPRRILQVIFRRRQRLCPR